MVALVAFEAWRYAIGRAEVRHQDHGLSAKSHAEKQDVPL